MDQKSATRGIRTYAKNAATAFTDFSDKLRGKLETNANTVDAVDFETFLERRALANIYSETLNLGPEGTTHFDDEKIIDRIQDKRQSLTDWLLTYRTQQSGVYAVHTHITQEATKRFLSETQIILLIDEEN
jgi:tagatose-1,6-bisphosphate aldolase non-catalytic subunit AgaZ/GatZ